MDSARERSTGNVISGVDLWLLEVDEIDKDNYECWGCSVAVNPVSFRPENKKCPHFRLFEGSSHLDGCVMEEEESEDDRYQRIRPKREGLPRPYPNCLVIGRKRIVGKTTFFDDKSGGENNGPNSPRGGGNTGLRRHNFSVGTIRPLAKHYMNRYSERHLPVRVFGSQDETFDSVFAELPNEVNIYLPKEHIYFGQLYFSAKTVESKNYVEVKLARGHWENNKLIDAYTVRINTADWSERAKTAVVSEINKTRDEYREAYRSGNSSSPAWLFFAGEQDPAQPTLIHVNLPQYVCCIIGTLRRSRYWHSWQPLTSHKISYLPRLQSSEASFTE